MYENQIADAIEAQQLNHNITLEQMKKIHANETAELVAEHDGLLTTQLAATETAKNQTLMAKK